MKITYIDINSLFTTSEKEFENLKEAISKKYGRESGFIIISSTK